MKKFMEWTGTLVGKLVLLVLSIILIGVLIFLCYYGYMEIQGSAAKDYLIDKYDLDDFDYVCTKYIKYEYSDISDCETSWFSECTDDENLAYKYVFTKKNKTKIVVIEDKNGDYQDDYEDVDNDLITNVNNES